MKIGKGWEGNGNGKGRGKGKGKGREGEGERKRKCSVGEERQLINRSDGTE